MTQTQVQKKCCLKNRRVSESAKYLQSSREKWYLCQREVDNVDPNESLNIAQDLVTNLTKNEPPGLFDEAPRNRLRSAHDEKSSSKISKALDKFLEQQDSRNLSKWDSTLWSDQ